MSFFCYNRKSLRKDKCYNMENKIKKASFTSSIGFVLAAAGSAVGLGNIWRFPYLAAQGGGGLFLIIYLILILTFGYTLLATDLIIGRKTKMNAINAYAAISKKWKFVGILTFIVPSMIMTYYSVIGGWVMKYILVYVTGQAGNAAADGYFTGFITSYAAPIAFMFLFLAVTAFIVYNGVEKGIEKFSKYVMPGLIIMVIGIAIFSVCLKHTDANGVTRTGLQGLGIYLIPRFEGITFSKFMGILLSALSQLFYSLSVSMGIMITYGSYVKDDVNLSKNITRIEIFDTGVAVLAGMMVIPAVFAFMGPEGLESSGAGLMFMVLPKVFNAMGTVGTVVGLLFFIMVAFAALTSSVSIMETIVSTCMEMFKASRKKVSLIIGVLSAIASVIVCLGYNAIYFELKLPTGATGQLLDVLDYISNSFLMPIISLCTCILIGWIAKPKWAIDEMEKGGYAFKKKGLYTVVIKYIAPILLVAMFLQSIGIFQMLGL